MGEIASGLSCLHCNNIIHGDLKPQNVLLQKGVAKLCDFGLSQFTTTGTPNCATCLGTIGFMSPELMATDGRVCVPGPHMDVWAFGSTCWSMVEQEIPFGTCDYSIFFVRNFVHSGKQLPIRKPCPPALEHMIRSCWHIEVDSRPSILEIQSTLGTICDANGGVAYALDLALKAPSLLE
jgi:serine/threonine protein kinase